MLAKHALSQLSYGPSLSEPEPQARKADRPSRRVAREAKATDVAAGA